MMLRLETHLLQMLTVVLLASLWSSFVQCRVIGQATDEDDTDMDGDTSWPVLCPADTYFDQIQDRCTECSQCPMNQVIISPCGGLRNTQCGPLLSFDIFNPASDDHGANIKIPAQTSGDAGSDIAPKGTEGDGDDKTKDDSDRNDETSPPVVETMVTEWKSLSLILIIVLTVVLAIFVVVVIAVCYVRSKSTSHPATKEALCEYQPAPTKV